MPRPVVIGRYLDWVGQDPSKFTDDYQVLEKYETSDFQTENHAKSRKNGVYTTGGNFLLWKHGHRASLGDAIVYRGGARTPAYIGGIMANIPLANSFPPTPSLASYGPEAFRRAKPDKPVWNLGNALYELKDVPGMLRQRFDIHNLKSIADYNVAIQFGWLPLLSDCISLYHSQRNLQERLKQLLRDNGKPVRRRFDMSNHAEDSVNTYDAGYTDFPDIVQNFVTQCYAGKSHYELQNYSKTRVWFSARSRFWLPDMGDLTKSQWKSWMVRRMLGLRPTPINVYRAIPWSWLIDWCSNVGDNIANLQTDVADRLIYDYAYLMRTKESGTRNIVHAGLRLNWDWDDHTYAPVRCQTESFVSRKERVGASPFGFSLKDEDLTDFQTNILTSLAIGKIHK